MKTEKEQTYNGWKNYETRWPNMKTKAQKKYDYEEVEWDAMIDLGLNYAIRTLDPLSNELNEGSSTLRCQFLRYFPSSAQDN